MTARQETEGEAVAEATVVEVVVEATVVESGWYEGRPMEL